MTWPDVAVPGTVPVATLVRDREPPPPPTALAVPGYEQAQQRFRALYRADLDNLPMPDPMIDGLLPRQGLAMLAGSRGLGKSLLALSIGATVASDLPTWMGHDVTAHGPVVYVSREGFHGVPERVRAWEDWSGRRADQVVWMPDPVNLSRIDDARLLAAYARHHRAVLVIADSARATGAGAEDTADMGAYVRGLETLCEQSGALVLVLHNSGWDGSRERGSTLLPDACDTTLILEGEPDGVRTLKHRKHRDGDMLDVPMRLEFRRIDSTRSGVLVPAAGRTVETLPEALLRTVTHDPGQTTAHYARALDRERTSVSKALNDLAHAGLLHNGGSGQRPAWHTAQTPLDAL